MSTTTVLFEAVDPFPDLNFPVTFRALIDYSSAAGWDVERFEAQGAQGGWLEIKADHVLRPVFDGYMVSRAAVEAVEGQIAREAEHEFVWPSAVGSYAHAAE